MFSRQRQRPFGGRERRRQSARQRRHPRGGGDDTADGGVSNDRIHGGRARTPPRWRRQRPYLGLSGDDKIDGGDGNDRPLSAPATGRQGQRGRRRRRRSRDYHRRHRRLRGRRRPRLADKADTSLTTARNVKIRVARASPRTRPARREEEHSTPASLKWDQRGGQRTPALTSPPGPSSRPARRPGHGPGDGGAPLVLVLDGPHTYHCYTYRVCVTRPRLARRARARLRDQAGAGGAFRQRRRAAQHRPGLHEPPTPPARRARGRRGGRRGRPRAARLPADRRRAAGLEEWVGTASGPTRLRDDFFMKLVFAREIGLADPAELIARQRALYLGALRDLENVLADGDADATTSLVVEGAALHLEADLKWLDRCEAVLGTEIHDLGAGDDRAGQAARRGRRGRDGARRRRPHGPPRRVRRRHRPERLRQVDAAEPARRPRPPDQRRGAGARRAPGRGERGPPRAPAPHRGRLRLPVLQPDRQPHRRGQRRAAGAAGRRPGPRARRARPSCSSGWGWARPRGVPGDLSGGQQPRVAIARASSTARACCSPTSRPATSTPPPPARSSRCSRSVTPTAGRSCSSPTTCASRAPPSGSRDARRPDRRRDAADARATTRCSAAW